MWCPIPFLLFVLYDSAYLVSPVKLQPVDVHREYHPGIAKTYCLPACVIFGLNYTTHIIVCSRLCYKYYQWSLPFQHASTRILTRVLLRWLEPAVPAIGAHDSDSSRFDCCRMTGPKTLPRSPHRCDLYPSVTRGKAQTFREILNLWDLVSDDLFMLKCICQIVAQLLKKNNNNKLYWRKTPF